MKTSSFSFTPLHSIIFNSSKRKRCKVNVNYASITLSTKSYFVENCIKRFFAKRLDIKSTAKYNVLPLIRVLPGDWNPQIEPRCRMSGVFLNSGKVTWKISSWGNSMWGIRFYSLVIRHWGYRLFCIDLCSCNGAYLC